MRLPLLCASALAGLLLLRPADARAQTPIVSSVEVSGAADPSLARYLSVKTGVVFDPETVRKSVLLLGAMDVFDDIAVEQESHADGTIGLIFRVTETPRLNDLVFVTREAAGPETPLDSGLAKSLRKASGFRLSESFRDKTIAEATKRMMEWLRANAYPRASIETEVVAPAGPPKQPGFTRDLKVRVLEAKEETLVSSRIDGWPPSLPAPLSPTKLATPLTVDTLDQWKQKLLDVLYKNAYYRAQIKTESVMGDLVFFVTPGPPYDLKLAGLDFKQHKKAKGRFESEGLSQDAIDERTSAIESDYVARGYRDVEVEFQENRTGERATAEFVVRPGAAWVLASVEYRVNGTPSAEEDSALKVGVPWIDRDIEAEKTRIRVNLVEKGHESASVLVEESGEPGAAKATFKIVPGALTIVGSVEIEGTPTPENRSKDAPATELATRENQPFRNIDVGRDRKSLLASLRDDGYVDARVEATADFSEDRSTVAIVLHVTSGPRVRVGQIVVVGLEDTKEKVVRRESRLKEGDFLSYQKLLDTQAGLSATGLFSSVDVREVSTDDDERNLIIEVNEGTRTTIVPGVGFQETDKLRASLEVTKLNISGLGRTASMFLRGSLRSQRALLSFTEPYTFGRRQAITLQTYFEEDRTRPAFDFRRRGFQTQTVFPLRSGSLLVQYLFQKTTTKNGAQSCAEVNRDLCDGKISGPSLGFIRDKRSDAIDPRRGTLLTAQTQLSLIGLGGDSFVKGSAFVARYEEIRAGVVLAGSARFGLARAFGRSLDVPLPERFFAGGASLLRAFRNDEVGPVRFTTNDAFIPDGGNALVAAQFEVRFDVARAWGVQIFAETGNVFAHVADLRFGQLREVAGFGVRYRSPFGPLRLDWGFKLDKRPEEKRGNQIHLGVGYAF
ncbi:MAG: BamA/TamA family outer membrane protein [Vicinamibacteria bacterium]